MKEWRFIHCSDIHLGQNPDGVWNNRVLTSKSFEIFRTFLSDVERRGVKIIVISGDISSCDDPQTLKKILSIFNVSSYRFILTGGNHDFISPEHNDILVKLLSRYSPASSLPFTMVYKNALFCSMSIECSLSTFPNLHTPCLSHPEIVKKDNDKLTYWFIPSEGLSWLGNTIKRSDKRIVFINLHCPILPVPDRCKFAGFRDSGILANSEEVINLLLTFVDKNFVVLSGHMHINYIVSYKNITQVVTSSLCEFPCEYREIIVGDGRISIKTHGLSNSKFAEDSLIPGKELTRGTNEDREYLLSL
ncbi:MAG: metallophosphoesterase [Candidatus Hydrogenedentes bacterium]|nr:metallophosphoesterase [Candidatus Hydrogenedentota bacterium]